MTTIYYLSTIIFIWSELTWIINPIQKANEARRFQKISKQFKGKKWDEYSPEYKSVLKSKIPALYMFIWLFIGFFTFQWVGFLTMLIFNILIVSPLSKLFKHTFVYVIIHWLNSLIGFGFSVFVIVNHYHLKIDLTQYFVSLFR